MRRDIIIMPERISGRKASSAIKMRPSTGEGASEPVEQAGVASQGSLPLGVA